MSCEGSTTKNVWCVAVGRNIPTRHVVNRDPPLFFFRSGNVLAGGQVSPKWWKMFHRRPWSWQGSQETQTWLMGGERERRRRHVEQFWRGARDHNDLWGITHFGSKCPLEQLGVQLKQLVSQEQLILYNRLVILLGRIMCNFSKMFANWRKLFTIRIVAGPRNWKNKIFFWKKPKNFTFPTNWIFKKFLKGFENSWWDRKNRQKFFFSLFDFLKSWV